MIWRLVLAQVATLQELETWWSIDDVLRANAVLDFKASIENVPPKGKK